MATFKDYNISEVGPWIDVTCRYYRNIKVIPMEKQGGGNIRNLLVNIVPYHLLLAPFNLSRPRVLFCALRFLQFSLRYFGYLVQVGGQQFGPFDVVTNVNLLVLGMGSVI